MVRKVFLLAAVLSGVLLFNPVTFHAPPAGAQTAAGAAVGDLPVELVVSIRGSDGSVPAGATLTWDYAVTNVGDAELSGLVIDDGAEGRVCLISTLSPGATTRCSLRTRAGSADYATTASVTGRYGAEPTPSLVTVTRAYTVASGLAPTDLAYIDVPRAPGQPAPSWPVDRWGPYAIAGAIAALTVWFTVQQLESKRPPSRRR